MTTPTGHPPQPFYGGPQFHHPHGGYPAPSTPVAKRIPENEPFVVRPNVAKRGLLAAGVVLVVVLPVAFLAVLGIVSSMEPEVRSGAIISVVGFFVCLMIMIALPLGIQLWLIGSGGPVLALSPAGLWIRTRPTRGQAIWMPWEAVARISRRRWSLEKMVVVTPHDPRMLQQLGAFTRLDSAPLNIFYGSGLAATLNFADRPEAEIMGAIAHYSAGRCPII
ncbi:hypothetical protein ACFY2Q_05580 [Micromonospora sp. NPDC000316]|uniref:hypothetical protein n=1 Tax=Micromonospora sp. NPDC000316 TaxID=3364216 RepID=UPI003679FD37